MLQDTKLCITTTATEPINIKSDGLDLEQVDSATSEGLSSSPIENKIKHRRTSSTVSGVFNINELGMSLYSLSALGFLANLVIQRKRA